MVFLGPTTPDTRLNGRILYATKIPADLLNGLIPVATPAFLDIFGMSRSVLTANIPDLVVLDTSGFQGIPQTPGEYVVSAKFTSTVITQIIDYVRSELSWNYLYVIGRSPDRLDPNSFVPQTSYFARGLSTITQNLVDRSVENMPKVRDIPILGDRTLEI